MNPELTAIVVNHRSAAEAAACVASLEEAFQREDVKGEIVLVDCASGPEEARILETVPADERVFLAENRGYSGGINAGLAHARAARLLIANADVLFLPGALTALLSEIADARVGAAAPLCVWDAAGRLRLPADSSLGFFGEVEELFSGYSEAADRRRFSAFARRTLRLWESGGDARYLVGAVLAVRRDVFDRVGHFDERFLFEYEETEWEDRVRKAGLRLRFVPRARVRHLYARSATRNPEAARRRAVSRRLYRDRRYGRLAGMILERAGSRQRAPRATPLAEPLVRAREAATLAISTNPSLIPFAGAALSEDFRLPAEIVASLPPGPLFLRVFRTADGDPLETFVWENRG
jgi:hypothetical protein